MGCAWGICYLRISKQEMQNFYLNWLQASGHAARCTTLVLKEDIYFGSSRKDAVLMCPTRFSQWPIKFYKKITVSNNYSCRYCNKSVVRFLALSRPRSGSETSSSTSSSTNSTPSPCPPSLPQDVQNRVAVEEVFPRKKNFWIGNRTTWTKLLFPGGPCPHWPPGSVGCRRLHREVSHFFSA